MIVARMTARRSMGDPEMKRESPAEIIDENVTEVIPETDITRKPPETGREKDPATDTPAEDPDHNFYFYNNLN